MQCGEYILGKTGSVFCPCGKTVDEQDAVALQLYATLVNLHVAAEVANCIVITVLLA